MIEKNIKTGMKNTTLTTQLTNAFLACRNDEQAKQLQRFFQTGPGQYGEGDCFLGIKTPVTRTLIRPYRSLATVAEYDCLLDSEWHEIRLAALLLMADQARRFAKENTVKNLRSLVALYDRRLERANNWDLVDMSVRDIMGAYWRCLRTPSQQRRLFLGKWAESGNLWRERAAMIAAWATQRLGSLEETFWLAEFFINHQHPLMHKAVGWMLRETGKIDKDALRNFLAAFHKQLPRTALRYAIEHFDRQEQMQWMANPLPRQRRNKPRTGL